MYGVMWCDVNKHKFAHFSAQFRICRHVKYEPKLLSFINLRKKKRACGIDIIDNRKDMYHIDIIS